MPPGLDAIVLKCLTKKPEGRYGAMDELAADLEKLERGHPPDAVGEMMARSGGFNVPADYFRSAGMPAPVPASPLEPRKRWPLYATIGAVGTVIAIVGGVLARSPSTPAQTPPAVAAPVQAVTAALPAPLLSAAAPGVAPAASAAVIAPLLHEVLVSVTPGDATITRDGENLGPSPVVLHMTDGESASLVVTRKGYKPKTVKVDGSTPRQTLALDPAWIAPSSRPAAAPAAGIDDVGDPFAKKR